MPKRESNIAVDTTGDETRIMKQNDGETVYATPKEELGEETIEEFSQLLTDTQKDILEALENNPDADFEKIAEEADCSQSSVRAAIDAGTLHMPLYTDGQVVEAIQNLSETHQKIVSLLVDNPDMSTSEAADRMELSYKTAYSAESNNRPLIEVLRRHSEGEELMREVVTREQYRQNDFSEEEEEEGGEAKSAEQSMESRGGKTPVIEELESLHQLFSRQQEMDSTNEATNKQLALVEHLLDVHEGE